MYTYIAELNIHMEALASCFTHLINLDQSVTGLIRVHSRKETEKCRKSWLTPITKCGRSEKILRRGRLAWAHCQPEQPRALGRRHGGRQLAQGATLPVPCHTVVPHSTLRAALFLHRHTTSHLVSDTVSRTWTLFSCQLHLWRHPVKDQLTCSPRACKISSCLRQRDLKEIQHSCNIHVISSMNICYLQELAMLVHCYTLYTVHCTGTLYNVLNNQIYQDWDYKTSINSNYYYLSSTKDICRISSHKPFPQVQNILTHMNFDNEGIK